MSSSLYIHDNTFTVSPKPIDTQSLATDMDSLSMASVYIYIDGNRKDDYITNGTIGNGTIVKPFITMEEGFALMTDITKSYVFQVTPYNYVSTNSVIGSAAKMTIYGNQSTWTVPSVTINGVHSIYDLKTIGNIIYNYTGTERSTRMNGSINGAVTINGGFPHFENLNYTGLMTITAGTPYFSAITGGGRIVVNGTLAQLILANPNLNMPTVDAANIIVTLGQLLCHGGLLVNKGTTLPNIVFNNTNTTSNPHELSGLICNTGIVANSSYVFVGSDVVSIITGTKVIYTTGIQSAVSTFGVGGGTAQVQTATIPALITSYVTGMEFTYVPSVTNIGDATVNVNGRGAKSMFRGTTIYGGTALLPGDIVDSIPCKCIYDGLYIRVLNPQNVREATTTMRGAMSASDKTKLDGLSAPLKNNMTASAIPNASNDSSQGYLEGSLWAYLGITYICTKSNVGSAVWVSSSDIFYFDTWASLIAAISVAGTTYNSKYCSVSNANGGASSGITYVSSTGAVTNPISDGGQATYFINSQGTTYTVTCQIRTITNPIITSIMLTATTKPTVAGYYIFTVVPTGGLPSGVSLNDIAYYNGSIWSVWQNYATANTVLVAGATIATQITWRKFQGTWMSTADEYIPDGNEYQTGKLYNGKAVYRKCSNGTMANILNSNVNAGFSVPMTGTILSIAGVCSRTDNCIITITGTGETQILVQNTGTVVTWTGSSLYLSRTFKAWVEYTKL